jgi:hypothetical protein
VLLRDSLSSRLIKAQQHRRATQASRLLLLLLLLLVMMVALLLLLLLLVPLLLPASCAEAPASRWYFNTWPKPHSREVHTCKGSGHMGCCTPSVMGWVSSLWFLL